MILLKYTFNNRQSTVNSLQKRNAVGYSAYFMGAVVAISAFARLDDRMDLFLNVFVEHCPKFVAFVRPVNIISLRSLTINSWYLIC